MKKFIRIFAGIIIAFIALSAALQAFTNVYDFSPARQFSGDTIYNPYKGMDSLNWKKANFHGHQRWMLFAMDFDYTAQEYVQAYKDNEYEIVGFADHQHINPFSHIPNYEHGVGVHKFHMLMLGANSVSWFDYPIMAMPQHQMQFQIDKFKPQVKLLALNHPSRTILIPISVYDNLMGYDLMEINPDFSAKHWDRALSNGIYCTLIANDDTHTIHNRDSRFQRFFTMVNTPSLQQDDILNALKEGRSYGVAITVEQNLKPDPHNDLPQLRDVSLRNDTISLRFDAKFDSVRFIGQDARIVSRVEIPDSTNSAYYKFTNADTYVRAEAFFSDGTRICTNPFYRTGGSVREPAAVNVLLTTVNAVFWSLLAIVLLWISFKVIKIRKKRSRDNYYGR